MLDEAFRDMGDDIYIQSRQSTDLFSVAHFRAKTKTTRILMRELLFADDSALVAHSAEEMQKIVDAFSDMSKKFGLKINIKKTEMLYQPNSTKTQGWWKQAKLCSEFTNLGSTIISNGCIDDEIPGRMAKASASFGRLCQRLWNNHHVSMRVKGKIYRAIVLSTLLYGAEAWTVYRQQVKKLHAFMMRHMRSIMRITPQWTKWQTRKYSNGQGCHSDQKESSVDWTTHEDVTRQATKAGSLLSTVFWSHKERAPSSSVQGYYQEKPEVERLIHGHHSHSREINGEQ